MMYDTIAALNLAALWPELWLAVTAMALLLFGAFKGDKSWRLVCDLAILALLVALLAVVQIGSSPQTAMYGQWLSNGFTQFCKILVLASTILALVLAEGYLRQAQIARPEYAVLMLFACLGLLLMISAADFLALYVGLELASLALYVLAAFRRDDVRSSEAGLKYFVLGALASGMLLYGVTLIYGAAGTTNFAKLALYFGEPQPMHMGVTIGLVLVLAGLAFKISAVPFHMWTPDVYEGAPTSVTAFFAAAPKIAGMALLLRVLFEPFGGLNIQWAQIITFCAVGSMVLGSFAALRQSNIKRLMAYSSIGHVGYALMGVATASTAGVRGVLIYLAIYLIMTLGVFGVIQSLRRHGKYLENITDFSGLSKSHPLLAFAMLVLMFSMAGVPPLAGFFGKFYVFMAAIEAHAYTIAVIGALTSAVAAFYYLKIIKLMYFDEPMGEIDSDIPLGTRLFLGAACAYLLFFVLAPWAVTQPATFAAQALLAR